MFTIACYKNGYVGRFNNGCMNSTEQNATTFATFENAKSVADGLQLTRPDMTFAVCDGIANKLYTTK